MYDLIQEIKKAAIFKKKWSKLELKLLITLFENESADNRIVCDFDSGEEICGFFKGSQLVAYIHTNYPIGFAKEEFHSFSKMFDKNISIVTIDDFNAPLWSVDLESLRTIAPEISWNACVDAVNPNCFSIDDFRFASH